MSLLDVVFVVALLVTGTVLFLSQRFWLRLAWRGVNGIRHDRARKVVRVLAIAVAAAALTAGVAGLFGMIPREWLIRPAVGLWCASSMLAYLSVKFVRGAEWLWHARRCPGRRAVSATPPEGAPDTAGEGLALLEAMQRGPAAAAALEIPSRRRFFQTASFVAGVAPFAGALYGFAGERLFFQVERVELALPGLDPALDGLRIVQLSDIHLSAYLTREQLRRAVDLANEQGAELAVLTGDFITGRFDALEDCVEELARLRAPLGVWGCLGNHEIYADCEERAKLLFGQTGTRILRQEAAEIEWRGARCNLIGVDYQRTHDLNGRRLPLLTGVDRLVRPGVTNLLLSHNPNAFPRAAQLGVHLTLAGHTHGGQIGVEILDRNITPARFVTPFIAGHYQRPLGDLSASGGAASAPQFAQLYVNRGIGTVGAPVRFGAPPEITLLTLRRA